MSNHRHTPIPQWTGPDWTARSFAAGAEAHVFDVGDFILTHRGHFAGALIRWGQRLRFRGVLRCYAHWNHAAFVVSQQGDLVEALVRSGATRSHISKYRDVEYTLVRVHATPADQTEMLRYADAVIGERYSFANDLAILLGYLTGGKLVFGSAHAGNCSGLVARGEERMGAYFDAATLISPAALAYYYNVLPPNAAQLSAPVSSTALQSSRASVIHVLPRDMVDPSGPDFAAIIEDLGTWPGRKPSDAPSAVDIKKALGRLNLASHDFSSQLSAPVSNPNENTDSDTNDTLAPVSAPVSAGKPAAEAENSAPEPAEADNLPKALSV